MLVLSKEKLLYFPNNCGTGAVKKAWTRDPSQVHFLFSGCVEMAHKRVETLQKRVDFMHNCADAICPRSMPFVGQILQKIP